MSLVRVFELSVEPGKPTCQRRQGILVSIAQGDGLEKLIEGNVLFPIERARVRLIIFADANGIDDDTVGLIGGIGVNAVKFGRQDGAGAAAFHLLEQDARFDISHEYDALQRSDVGAGGNHINGYGDSGIV